MLEEYHFGKDYVQRRTKSFIKDLVRLLKRKETREYSVLNTLSYKTGYIVQFILSRLSNT